MHICLGMLCVICVWNVAVSLLIKLCQCLSTIDTILAQGQRPAAGSQVFFIGISNEIFDHFHRYQHYVCITFIYLE